MTPVETGHDHFGSSHSVQYLHGHRYVVRNIDWPQAVEWHTNRQPNSVRIRFRRVRVRRATKVSSRRDIYSVSTQFEMRNKQLTHCSNNG